MLAPRSDSLRVSRLMRNTGHDSLIYKNYQKWQWLPRVKIRFDSASRFSVFRVSRRRLDGAAPPGAVGPQRVRERAEWVEFGRRCGGRRDGQIL